MRRVAALGLVVLISLGATGCVSMDDRAKNEQKQIIREAETARVCVEGGGEYYPSGGFGPYCHFDSRKGK